MKRLLLLSLAAVGFSSAAFAQSVTFRVENNYVMAGGVALNQSNYNIDGFNTSVYTATTTLANIQALSFNQSDPSAFISEIQGLATAAAFDGSTQQSDGWVQAGLALGPVANANTWNNERLSLTPGLHPVMLITTNPLGELTANDYVGLVYWAGEVAAFTDRTIGFTTATQWDNFILGESGSFELTAIPEPRTYAAILGLLTLGLVVWRRRSNR